MIAPMLLQYYIFVQPNPKVARAQSAHGLEECRSSPGASRKLEETIKHAV